MDTAGSSSDLNCIEVENFSSVSSDSMAKILVGLGARVSILDRSMSFILAARETNLSHSGFSASVMVVTSMVLKALFMPTYSMFWLLKGSNFLKKNFNNEFLLADCIILRTYCFASA